mmetsp:Transcript_63639/g.175562  ORF Transcript_63639/g.175562 Transcript_63639/m.175562 type:complete len:230 (+) Transcript_63639:881-1570(+)
MILRLLCISLRSSLSIAPVLGLASHPSIILTLALVVTIRVSVELGLDKARERQFILVSVRVGSRLLLALVRLTHGRRDRLVGGNGQIGPRRGRPRAPLRNPQMRIDLEWLRRLLTGGDGTHFVEWLQPANACHGRTDCCLYRCKPRSVGPARRLGLAWRLASATRSVRGNHGTRPRGGHLGARMCLGVAAWCVESALVVWRRWCVGGSALGPVLIHPPPRPCAVLLAVL